MSADIADKLKKIIAKADGTSNEAEAATFMAKAQQLMIEHGLTLLDLGKLDSDDPVGHARDMYHNQSDAWKKLVGWNLGTYYGCKVIMSKETISRTAWVVFGRESARTTFALMWPYIDQQVSQLAKQATAAGHYETLSKAKTAIGNSLAIRIGILNRERAEAEKATSGASGKATGLTALVPVDIIESAIAEVFPHTKTTSRKGVKTDGVARSLAGQVRLNAQVGAGSGARRIGAS